MRSELSIRLCHLQSLILLMFLVWLLPLSSCSFITALSLMAVAGLNLFRNVVGAGLGCFGFTVGFPHACDVLWPKVFGRGVRRSRHISALSVLLCV